jgi:hypothetical protein
VHGCGESRGVPDCRSVQHDALKPERLGLLCGSESEAHGAQVSALRAARLRRPPHRLSRALGVSRTDGRRGAPKSYLPRGQIGRFPCPNMIPRRTASSDYAISHLRFSFQSFKPSGACAHTQATSRTHSSTHTAPICVWYAHLSPRKQRPGFMYAKCTAGRYDFVVSRSAPPPTRVSLRPQVLACVPRAEDKLVVRGLQ